MSKDDNEVVYIFKQIYNVIRVHGIKNVIRRLQQLEEHGIDHHKIEVIESVIGSVCSEYSLSRNDLFKLTKGNGAEARKMCYILLYENTKLTRQQIALRFQRDAKVVYRAIEEYAAMNGIGKWEQQFLERKKNVENNILQLLVKQKQSDTTQSENPQKKSF